MVEIDPYKDDLFPKGGLRSRSLIDSNIVSNEVIKDMPRGGTRPGSGRKKSPAKHLKVTANEAERLLEELNWQGELKQIYRNCNDPKLKLQIITVLQARSWGRPETAKVAKHTEPPPSLNVNQTPSDRLLEILSRAAARRKKALAGGAD